MARAYHDSARVLLERRFQVRPDDSGDLTSLGLAHAGLGHREAARRAGERTVELAMEIRPGAAAFFEIPARAQVCMLIGDYDAAVDRFAQLLSVPSLISKPLLRFDPLWEPLRDHPGFRRLIEQ